MSSSRKPLEAHAGLDQALAIGLVRRHQADRGVDAVVAAGQQAQALRGLVEQLGLGQDAAADRDHGVGGQDVGAAELLVVAHKLERGLGLCARQPIGAGARQLSALRRLVDIGRTQRIGLDAGLIDERDPAGRAGREHELRPANHFCLRNVCMERTVELEKRAYLNR